MSKYAMILCVVFATLCSVHATAQWVKGSNYAGLRVGLGPKESGFLVGADFEQAITKGNDTYGPGSIGVGASIDYTTYSKTLLGITQSNNYIFFSIYGAYHFSPSMDDKRFDPYILLGLAPYYFSATTKNEATGFVSDPATKVSAAFVAALGARYFFTPQWSGHLRLGFGSSFVSAGVTMTL